MKKSPQLAFAERNSEISQVNSKQLESRHEKNSKALETEQKRYDRLFSQLQLTKQQIEMYSQEGEKALEGIKDCNWRLTKDLCIELRKIQSPSQCIVEVCEKVMLVLEQPEISFQSFKKFTKNYSLFKMLMSSCQHKAIPDSTITELLPIWKNQTIIQAKLYKKSKCGSLLAQWLNLLVEYSLKKETIQSSKRREPELEKKTANSLAILNNLAKEQALLHEIISNRENEEPEILQEEFTERFRFINGAEKNVPPVLSPGVSMNNFSILGCSKLNSFPNFNGHDLYAENSVKQINNTSYEKKAIDIGCCKLRFWCF